MLLLNYTLKIGESQEKKNACLNTLNGVLSKQ